MDLLHEALKNDYIVDMSPFQKFTSRDISLLASNLTSDGALMDINLPSMHMLTKDDLDHIWSAKSSTVQCLGLMNCHQISINKLSDLELCGDIYHSA